MKNNIFYFCHWEISNRGLKWPAEGYCPPARYEFQTVKVSKDTPLRLSLWDLAKDCDWKRVPVDDCHEKMALQQMYAKYFRVS